MKYLYFTLTALALITSIILFVENNRLSTENTLVMNQLVTQQAQLVTTCEVLKQTSITSEVKDSILAQMNDKIIQYDKANKDLAKQVLDLKILVQTIIKENEKVYNKLKRFQDTYQDPDIPFKDRPL